MLGKLANLVTNPLRNGFEVSYGVSFNSKGIANLEFATLFLSYNKRKRNHCIIYCRKIFRHSSIGYNEFTVENLMIGDKPDVEEVEDRLWVIIPYSSTIIKTTANTIVHTFANEALLEMKVGDVVTVDRTSEGPETYMAVQAGNEILLVKKTR